ncbi:hypothetical protein [Streptomyces sp. NPDC046385]|uniref:hypothetical protein n=1 Tax=unclassified Streptomyces TaxID=2593676 RepID=UPI0033F202F4
MATPTPPSPRSPFENWVVDNLTWIDPADYKRTKEAAFGWTSTATAIKTDLSLIKAELAGLSVFSIGASVIKFDYTWFKMDEKGVTINGRQRVGWPWADPAKAANLKAENRFRKLDKKQQDLKDAIKRLETARTDAPQRRADMDQARADMNAARRSQHTAASLAAFHAAEKKYLAAKKLSEKADKELRDAEKAAKSLEQKASKRFQDAKKFVDRENEMKKKWENQGNKVLTEDLNRLRTAVGKVELKLDGTEQSA